MKYDILERTLKEVCTDIQCEVIGFGDMDVDEVCVDTGLSAEVAALAKRRDYDEAFRVLSPAPKGDEMEREIVKRGFNCTRGGRYYHIMGNNDKGRGVDILTALYRRKWPGIRTIGLGDSLNDLPMLEAVDVAILVQKPGGLYDPAILHTGIIKADGIGPAGWNRELINILE